MSGETYNALAVAGQLVLPVALALLLLPELLLLDLVDLFRAVLRVCQNTAVSQEAHDDASASSTEIFKVARIHAASLVKERCWRCVLQGYGWGSYLRRRSSLPTARALEVWKERTGAETNTLLETKDRESMLGDLLMSGFF